VEFIAEVRALLDRGGKLMGCTHDIREFRNWRHEAESTVANAWALGFKLPGEFKSRPRAYRAMWMGASSLDNRNAFVRDMDDSLAELRFLVDQFDKFGAPGKPAHNSAQQAAVPLASPDKVTVRWLIDNVPISGWVIFGGLIVGLFSAGYAAGQYDTLRKLVAIISAIFTSSAPPH
jgi:hypothetical protein